MLHSLEHDQLRWKFESAGTRRVYSTEQQGKEFVFHPSSALQDLHANGLTMVEAVLEVHTNKVVCSENVIVICGGLSVSFAHKSLEMFM